MRRIGVLLAAAVLVLTLAFSVSGAVAAPKISFFATVSQDGSAQVTQSVTLRLDQVAQDLYYPVPGEATNVTVNGSMVSSRVVDNVRQVRLDRVLGKITGEVSFSVSYRLHDVVHTNDAGVQELRLPMLSGFESTVSLLEFSVTLPGSTQALPAFFSGYHQQSIEKDLSYKVEGATVSGTSLTELKDHETLTLLLIPEEAMFPQSLADTRDWSFGAMAMGICGLLALIYWLLMLRHLPWRREDITDPPEGLTAGELGCVMHMQGIQLALTVYTWAQLGYLQVQLDRKGQVILHKRMDMGNERKESERKLFGKLFGKQSTVHTGSSRYAALTAAAKKKPAGIREHIHKRSGNAAVFRALASGIGLFGGVCIAISVSGGAVLQIFLILLLGALGGISGWLLQLWAANLRRDCRHRLYLCGGILAFWLLLGAVSGMWVVTLWMLAGLLAAGVLLAWAGRRTQEGVQEAARLRGLRRYLRTLDKAQVQRICQTDPEYFFRLAPCAIALGVGEAFAGRFGGIRLESCGCLITPKESPLTAKEWMKLLQYGVDAMNRRARRLPLEQLLGLLYSLRR
ncbi:MAG: DUF2207 domain-containing protein [Oscillospiraceae bacterium]|nr:DUF2207 domain-containing protein [Oscillospiraceae bacterium]